MYMYMYVCYMFMYNVHVRMYVYRYIVCMCKVKSWFVCSLTSTLIFFSVTGSGWSTEGVTVEAVTRMENVVVVTCSSFHLTSFAVLVDVGGTRVRTLYMYVCFLCMLYIYMVHYILGVDAQLIGINMCNYASFLFVKELKT